MLISKVIRIRAEDSPNVKLGMALAAKGLPIPDEPLMPGVIDYPTYLQRRKTWDPVRQCIGLDGQFYEGAEQLLYPPLWLNNAEAIAATQKRPRPGLSMGVDTGEGGDDTAWAILDGQGLIHLEAYKTPNTTVIPNRTKALIHEYGIDPEMVMFDQGGGGTVHAQRLQNEGYDVRMVSFAESVSPDPVRFMKAWEEKQFQRREKHAYKNRRAQMYYLFRLRLDPDLNEVPFGIPAEYTELRRQLSVMPLEYDDEGRIKLRPKNRRTSGSTKTEPTLQEMLGCSPDEADAVVLANYAMQPESQPITIEPMF